MFGSSSLMLRDDNGNDYLYDGLSIEADPEVL